MSTRTLIAATRREVSELQASRAKGPHIPVAIGAVILLMGAIEVAVHSSLVNGIAAGPLAYISELQQPAALLGAIYIAHALGPGVARSALLLLAAVLIPAFIAASPNAVVEVVGFAAFVAITLTAVRMIGHRRLLASRLEALYRSAALVSSSIDPDDVLTRVLTATRDILGYRHVAIFSIEGDRLIPTTWSGYEDVPHDLSLRRGITGRAARTGAPQLVSDVASDPEFVSGMAASRSEIAYPLRVDEEVIGVLNVETAAPQVLGPDDLELLGSLAVQVGVALRHARQHRRIQVLATRDGLTGLHNHAAFQERLREELARADRHGRSVAVVIRTAIQPATSSCAISPISSCRWSATRMSPRAMAARSSP